MMSFVSKLLWIVLTFLGIISVFIIRSQNTRKNDSICFQAPLFTVFNQSKADYQEDRGEVFLNLGYKFISSSENKDIDVLLDYHTDRNYVHIGSSRKKYTSFVAGLEVLYDKFNFFSLNLPYVPTTFILPDNAKKFKKYREENPDTIWFMKLSVHGGLGVRFFNASDPGKFGLTRRLAFQKYISNPLLIDGRKFDMGIYVLVSSIDPLLVYMYRGDCVVKFCQERFDKTNLFKMNATVIDPFSALRLWQLPELNEIMVNYNLSVWKTLYVFIEKQGCNTTSVDRKLTDIIRKTLLSTEEKLTSGRERKEFEIVRFDFIMDDKCHVYLMEMNRSPGLRSRLEGQPRKKEIHERMVYSALHLLGLAHNNQFTSKYRNFEVRDRGTLPSVYKEYCDSSACAECGKKKCLLCNHCLSDRLKTLLIFAHKENLRKHEWQRLIPNIMEDESDAEFTKDLDAMSLSSQWFYRWCKERCQEDPMWCS